MNERKQTSLTIFVSYAHEDERYVNVFTREFEKHAGLTRSVKWKTWKDSDIPKGRRWHQYIRQQADGCDVTMLMISPRFLNSPYLVKEEFVQVLKRSRDEGFFIFPLLLENCDLSFWEPLDRQLTFTPKGIEYGKPWVPLLAYGDLVEFQNDGNTVQPDPNRKRLMLALGKVLTHALQNRPKPKKQEKEEKYYKFLKPSSSLLPGDILGPGLRSTATMDFYWQRKIDREIKEVLESGHSLLVLGNSLAGKTRAVYEALKNIENATILMPPDRFFQEEDIQLPEKGEGPLIAVFDDIDQLLNRYSKIKLEAFLFKLIESGATIAATCRRGNEYRFFDSMISHKIREQLKIVTIKRMNDYQVKAFHEFCQKISKKGKPIELDTEAFDGNIGSYFMDLTQMGQRFRDMDKIVKEKGLSIHEALPRQILIAAKYFYYTENTEGRSFFKSKKIKDFCERRFLGKGKRRKPRPGKTQPMKTREKEMGMGSIWQDKLGQFVSPDTREEYSTTEWNEALSVLSSPGFGLDFLQVEGPLLYVDEVYLERVVARNLRLENIISILKETYKGEEIQKHGFLTSVFGFNRLVHMARSMDEAYTILKKLAIFGIPFTVATFTSLINKAGTYKEALSLLEKMVEHDLQPNLVTFNSLINKARSQKDALAILSQMEQHQVKPDRVTFTSLINKAESFQVARDFLEKMKEHHITPDSVTFTSLINKAETFKDAFAFLGEMQQYRVEPDRFSFTSLINKADNFKDALSLLEKMEELKIQPNEFTFTSLINKADTFKAALTFLEKMKTHNVQPNVVTFNSLVNKADTFQEAVAFLEKMKEHQTEPNVITFTTLLNKTDTFQDAVTYLEKMKEHRVKPNMITFSSLLNKVHSGGDAMKLMEEMHKYRIRPTLTMFHSLIEKVPTLKEKLLLWERIKKVGITPDKNVVDLVMDTVRREPKQALAQLLENYQPSNVFASYFFNRIIGEACRADSSCVAMVLAHKPVIIEQRDTVLLYYARMFEYNSLEPEALELLEHAEEKNFDYFNIKANCFKKSDPVQSMELYHEALKKTGDDRQQSIVLNNMAQLLLDTKNVEKFPEAIDYCKKALELRPYNQFSYPGQLLLQLSIYIQPVDLLGETVEHILNTYGIAKSELATQLEYIEDPAKKEIIEKIMS